jgi:MFS family permease
MPSLNVYYDELGLTGQQIGWLASQLLLAMLLFATPITSLADRRRWRVQLLQIAFAGSGAIIFFLRFSNTFSGLGLLIMPMAVFNSPIMSIVDSLITHGTAGSPQLWWDAFMGVAGICHKLHELCCILVAISNSLLMTFEGVDVRSLGEGIS